MMLEFKYDKQRRLWRAPSASDPDCFLEIVLDIDGEMEEGHFLANIADSRGQWGGQPSCFATFSEANERCQMLEDRLLSVKGT